MKFAPEMHLPQIAADLIYRRKIAEKVFSVNLRAVDQRILRENDDIIFQQTLSNP
jgi:hypothetical protein